MNRYIKHRERKSEREKNADYISIFLRLIVEIDFIDESHCIHLTFFVWFPIRN